MVSTFVASVAVTVLQLVYLLINCFIWHRHQSRQNGMGMTGIPLDWRRVGGSCRNAIVCEDCKFFLSSIAFTFCNSSAFSSIVSSGTGINQRRIEWGRQGYLWIGVEWATRVAIGCFVTRVSAFVASVAVTVLQFGCLLIISTTYLRHQSSQNQMRNAWMA